MSRQVHIDTYRQQEGESDYRFDDRLCHELSKVDVITLSESIFQEKSSVDDCHGDEVEIKENRRFVRVYYFYRD